MNIKNTKPTPRSITHKNPIYMSASLMRLNNPMKMRYKPPVYKSIVRFVLVMYEIIEIKTIVSKIKVSLNTISL